MKVIEKGSPLFAAYKNSRGYMSSGWSGPMFFSSRTNSIVTADSKYKDGKIYFIDQSSADRFANKYNKWAKEYKDSHGGSSESYCTIENVNDNSRLRNKIFGSLDSIAVEERQTAFGPAYRIADDLEK